jgi:Putative MetA-pathway of phenol degradation
MIGFPLITRIIRQIGIRKIRSRRIGLTRITMRPPGRLIGKLILGIPVLLCLPALAQGGPPYYTNDPGTPGPFNWEINVGYMPFLYSDQSVSHTPDLDINFGVGERIQLTYENAWLRVNNPASQSQPGQLESGKTEFGLGQSNPGVKWRFYDAGESGLSVSVFPQLFLNNPNDAVRRGITSPSSSFLLPVEFSRKFGPIDVDYELGYQFVHKGPDGWLMGLVVGHEFTKKFEVDMELYSQGTFHPSGNQPSIDFGARYKLHNPIILLVMAGRSLEPARNNQPYFLGYFGLQFLLPSRAYNRE